MVSEALDLYLGPASNLGWFVQIEDGLDIFHCIVDEGFTVVKLRWLSAGPIRWRWEYTGGCPCTRVQRSLRGVNIDLNVETRRRMVGMCQLGTRIGRGAQGEIGYRSFGKAKRGWETWKPTPLIRDLKDKHLCMEIGHCRR